MILRRPVLVFLAVLWVGCTQGNGTEARVGGGGHGGAAGRAGSGLCASGLSVVQQVAPTETTCDLRGSPTQCADTCDTDCAEGDFALGSMGSGCARAEDGSSYCRCICAECR